MKYINLEPEKFYHIYNRGNNSQNLFFEDANYIHFLNLIEKYLVPVSEIYAYCLLKNHFHLLVRIRDINDLEVFSRNNRKFSNTTENEKIWRAFSNLFNAYTKAINRRYKRTGSLFESKYKRKEVTTKRYLYNLIHYINFNPIKHGFCSELGEYPYSSYNKIVHDKKTFIEKQEIIELYDDMENFLFCHKRNPDEDNLGKLIIE
jgi:REP element-mobilizing transposase RayT